MVAPRELLTANVLMFFDSVSSIPLGSALGGLTAAQFGYKHRVYRERDLLRRVGLVHNADTGQRNKEAKDAIPGESGVRRPMSAEAVAITRLPGVSCRFKRQRPFCRRYPGGAPVYLEHAVCARGDTGQHRWGTGGECPRYSSIRLGARFLSGPGDRGDWGLPRFYARRRRRLYRNDADTRAWVCDVRRAARWSFHRVGVACSRAALLGCGVDAHACADGGVWLALAAWCSELSSVSGNDDDASSAR